MSVINKVPAIQELFELLPANQLAKLRLLVNGSNEVPLERTINNNDGRTKISAADEGVHLCNLQIGNVIEHGYLICGGEEYCALISFTDSQLLKLFWIWYNPLLSEVVPEYLDVNEFRRLLFETPLKIENDDI